MIKASALVKVRSSPSLAHYGLGSSLSRKEVYDDLSEPYRTFFQETRPVSSG